MDFNIIGRDRFLEEKHVVNFTRSKQMDMIISWHFNVSSVSLYKVQTVQTVGSQFEQRPVFNHLSATPKPDLQESQTIDASQTL